MAAKKSARKAVTLDSLATLIAHTAASADKKFAALSEDISGAKSDVADLKTEMMAQFEHVDKHCPYRRQPGLSSSSTRKLRKRSALPFQRRCSHSPTRSLNNHRPISTALNHFPKQQTTNPPLNPRPGVGARPHCPAAVGRNVTSPNTFRNTKNSSSTMNIMSTDMMNPASGTLDRLPAAMRAVKMIGLITKSAPIPAICASR
jgi:hypothetical protein